MPGLRLGIIVVLTLGALVLPRAAFAQDAARIPPCPRPVIGSVVAQPPDLYSADGVLEVTLLYRTTVDATGRTLFCFMTPDGLQSPTLHVKPGDRLELTVTNTIHAPPRGSPTEPVSNPRDKCGDQFMTITSVNVHFHGTNTSPACHADQVVRTIINSGKTFKYVVKFPKNEPPGLYWYHQHVHGLSEAALQGGASGAIVVEGIERLQPAVAGLKQRILLVRDQTISVLPGGNAPSWDISLNYVPILYPKYVPAVLEIQRGTKELWRVVNASSDTIIELALNHENVAQPLEIVALDGVPTGSQDGTRRGKIVVRDSIRLPPAARAEFIVAAPGEKVRNAGLVTHRIDTGPLGDSDPERPLATIKTIDGPDELPLIPAATSPAGPQLFEGLDSVKVSAKRTLYFSERQVFARSPAPPEGDVSPHWGEGNFEFFITVDGQKPTLFNALNPPNIVTKQGAVEDWTIENRSTENHEFHMHQVHFVLLERNGAPVPAEQRQFLDMVEVPYWTGSGPYPSVKVRMDFRGMDVGEFVYHCHILGHEDAGMMGIIRILPPS